MTRFFVDVGHGFRETFYMFWETLWALVLGFTMSGVVQAFVSRHDMERRLGDHRPASAARAALYGTISSSCSYAASAMARSLVVRGADFAAAMIFMFASTNLVVELGIVLAVLIGWQFLVAQFVGGVIMIALIVLTGGLWLRGRSLASHRGELLGPGSDHCGRADDATAVGNVDGAVAPSRHRLRNRSRWRDAAAYTLGDLRMLRKEMLIGFTAAGFLSSLVPVHAWNDFFVHGHGFWTSAENVVVGPFIAVISCVCSIGNVPVAAALWKGGIAFGGVVSFMFADLIALPLLLIYRKHYGGRIALRLLVIFWSMMAVAGLATEYLFRGLGWIPTSRPAQVAGDALRWNYTTGLDIAALVVFVGVCWFHRGRNRLDRSATFATDPMCGMQVEKQHAPAWLDQGRDRVFFCSERCRDRFARRGVTAG